MGKMSKECPFCLSTEEDFRKHDKDCYFYLMTTPSFVTAEVYQKAWESRPIEKALRVQLEKANTDLNTAMLKVAMLAAELDTRGAKALAKEMIDEILLQTNGGKDRHRLSLRMGEALSSLREIRDCLDGLLQALDSQKVAIYKENGETLRAMKKARVALENAQHVNTAMRI